MRVDAPMWWNREHKNWFYTTLYDVDECVVRELADEKGAVLFSFDSERGIEVEKIEDYEFLDEYKPLKAIPLQTKAVVLEDIENQNFFVSSYWVNAKSCFDGVFADYESARRHATENHGKGVILSLKGEGQYLGLLDFNPKYKVNGMPRVSENSMRRKSLVMIEDSRLELDA